MILGKNHVTMYFLIGNRFAVGDDALNYSLICGICFVKRVNLELAVTINGVPESTLMFPLVVDFKLGLRFKN